MALAIGIDLGGTNLRVAGIERNGEIITRVKIPTARFSSAPELITGIVREVQKLVQKFQAQPRKVLGVGIGAPGGIDPAGEMVYFSPNYPEWRNLPLRRILEERLNLKIRLGNDANMWAYGEGWIGAGQNHRNFVLLTLGTGVGGGIVIEGKLHRGHTGIAGEIGHITIEPDGFPCECGSRGCLETLASSKGITRMAQEFLEQGKQSLLSRPEYQPLTSLNVYQAALRGDHLALLIMERVGRALGIGISSLINILNPEIVILGGGVAAARELFYRPMVEEIKLRAFSEKGKETPVVSPLLGEDAGILGAARLIFEDEN